MNRLVDALSPYLQQHADQAVDWQPWDRRALDRARTEDRPILLSIGYAACHWCHVMARESFDDPDIARRMNAWFISIKVDREERPDLDRLYQLAHQLLTGRGGGWPLTMFLDPGDLTPFVAGTYFPPRSRGHQIGFDELLERVHSAWTGKREAIASQNRQLRDTLNLIARPRVDERIDADQLVAALMEQLQARFDRRHGGFGTSPKFPQPPLLDALLHASVDDQEAASMLLDTLRAMARNGLQDQLGGGFFRYCVDQAWEIPHFEKMLGDNAQLLGLYAAAARRWNDPELAEVAANCAEFLERELRLTDGGYGSSLAADSMPEDASPDDLPAEGEVYLWTPTQVAAALDPEAAALASARWGLDGPANFHGRWHLIAARGIDELIHRRDEIEELRQRLDAARRELLTRRMQRPQPARDDKMLASVNALTALGLARAGRMQRRQDWIERADRLIEHVLDRHFGSEPAVAVWRAGRPGALALLDDHAATLLAILELLQHQWSSPRLDAALDLAEMIERRFVEPGSGRLYLTPEVHEPLPMRPAAGSDDATPSGAALTIRGWLRLGHLLGEPRWLDAAERALACEAGTAVQAPLAHAALIQAALEWQSPPVQVILGGKGPEPELWQRRLLDHDRVLVYRVGAEDSGLPPALEAAACASQPQAVVCRGKRCSAPRSNWDEIAAEVGIGASE